MEDQLFSLPARIWTTSIDFSDDKSISDAPSKDDCGVFHGLKHLRSSPGEAMGTRLFILSAHIPRLCLKHEDESGTGTDSDELETESASDAEDCSESEPGDESENDCCMPSLDDLGFVDIHPQLEDVETEMLKLIWSISSYKRRYYDQEGLAMARRILATEGAKLFFVDSKRPSLRQQMLNAVASGLTPKQQQFIHLILVFWAKVEVIEVADDLLLQQPSPEQERILQVIKDSEGLINENSLSLAVQKWNLTPQTVTRLEGTINQLFYPGALRFVRRNTSKVYQQSHPGRDPTIPLKEILKMFPKMLSESLHNNLTDSNQGAKKKRRLDVEVKEEEERSKMEWSKRVKTSSVDRT
ncbi:uncharacterized protein FFNC_15659 [Fusarium fujikuroi]|nr:uncharacterized protein FFNC_15659 [Fusarium fujikuroi]